MAKNGRTAILSYLDNIDPKNITSELLLALDSFRMILKADSSIEIQTSTHKVLNYIISNDGWIHDRQNW